MPEFLTEYQTELDAKSKRIISDYEDKKINKFYEPYFTQYWNVHKLTDEIPAEKVLAVDGSMGVAPIGNGGIFYVVRALGIDKEKRYRKIFADFNYSNERNFGNFVGRLMEWTEHLVMIDAIKDGFRDFILLDGSIYGRLAHVPLEWDLLNSKGFMIEYFDTIIELLSLCKNHSIPIIGISKESKTSFFREFLIKEMIKDIIPDDRLRKKLISVTLNDRRLGVQEAQKTGDKRIITLINELVHRKPDSLLVLSRSNNGNNSGYTQPLILGGSQRWHRAVREIERSARSYITSNFPVSSEDDEFMDRAVEVVERLTEVPAIISFHLLPQVIDTPMRIDIPAWYFDSPHKLKEMGWPEPIEIDLDTILKLISSGYCGLENYNIWLSHVDSEVKLKRNVFEELYINKFEEIIGTYSTARGYRRVRYP
ncbi:MAG: NurA domain protein [Promethearchaeota archaeon]|nr:MAG: NurA domain protein [Candidatus Lokiarchaeota archaeon]